MPPENDSHDVILCQLNGEMVRTSLHVTLTAFVAECGYQGEGFATALNGEFVPRSQYSSTRLKNGDAVDIVAPVTGG